MRSWRLVVVCCPKRSTRGTAAEARSQAIASSFVGPRLDPVTRPETKEDLSPQSDAVESPGSARPTARIEALRRANDIRLRRAELKRKLKSGDAELDALLRSPPDYLETAKVFDLLLAVPKYGRVKVNKLLTQCQISPSKTVGGLSDRQRQHLISFIQPAGKTVPEPSTARPSEVDRFADEIKRLLAEPELDASAVERAARTAAAAPVWEEAVGRLLTVDQLLAALDMGPEQLAGLLDAGDVITLTSHSGAIRFPEFQFADGLPMSSLTRAHRLLVHQGRVSPWSAAAWLTSPHPDLDGLSPAQWASERRDDERLQAVARRDAEYLAH
jgi:hypothetical protein